MKRLTLALAILPFVISACAGANALPPAPTAGGPALVEVTATRCPTPTQTVTPAATVTSSSGS
ncbi:MAG: hypothetical protein WCF84_25465, partial [Anaerolineae bacterium]